MPFASFLAWARFTSITGQSMFNSPTSIVLALVLNPCQLCSFFGKTQSIQGIAHRIIRHRPLVAALTGEKIAPVAGQWANATQQGKASASVSSGQPMNPNRSRQHQNPVCRFNLRNHRYEPAGLTCRYIPPESANSACLRSGGQTALPHWASVTLGVRLRGTYGGTSSIPPIVPPPRPSY